MGQRPRKETKLQALLKSPWTWVGVGGAVTLVLLLLLVFLLTSPSPERTAEAPEPSQRSVELLLMLAGLTEIDLGTSRQSVNPNLVRFYPAVGSAAFAAAHQLGLRVTDKAPAVLAVDMQADETSASPNVRLLLELTYTLPDGRRFTLWKGDKQILAADLSSINSLNENPYKAKAAQNTVALFKELVNAVLRARAETEAK